MSLFPTVPRKKIKNRDKMRSKIFVEQPPNRRHVSKILTMEHSLERLNERDCETTRPITNQVTKHGSKIAEDVDEAISPAKGYILTQRRTSHQIGERA